MPDPDGLALSQADRQQVVGVYPGILVGEASASGGEDILLHHHHYYGNGNGV